MANPIETEKIRTHHAKIVVECTTGKPYYSIEWFDPAKQEYFLGYSSYCIDNVVAWLAEYFEIVEAPKTNADRIRAMSDEELVKYFWDIGVWDSFEDGKFCDNNCNAEHNCDLCRLKWLQQPCEEDG